MQTIRRGGATAGAPNARGGASASSHGSARAPPAVRRQVGVAIVMARPSRVLKDLARDDRVKERPKTVALLPQPSDDRVDRRRVAGAGRAAGPVRQELNGQGLGEPVLVLQQELLEFVDVLN